MKKHKSKSEVLTTSHYGESYALRSAYTLRGGETAIENLRALRGRLQEYGHDFTADVFFAGKSNARLLDAHAHNVGDILDVLHEAGQSVPFRTLKELNTYRLGDSKVSRSILENVVSRGGVRRLLASHYWDDHPEDLDALREWLAKNKNAMLGITENHYSQAIATAADLTASSVEEVNPEGKLANLRAELQAAGHDLTKDDFFEPMGTEQRPQLMRGDTNRYDTHNNGHLIGAVLHILHDRGERVSAQELTQAYSAGPRNRNMSILERVVMARKVATMLASPYWENYPEDRAAVKNEAREIGKDYVQNVRKATIGIGDSTFKSLALGVNDYDVASFRKALQTVGVDMGKVDIFGADTHTAVPLARDPVGCRLLPEWLALMDEQGERVPPHKFRDLMGHAANEGVLEQTLRAPYWNKYPVDLLQVWDRVPAKIQKTVRSLPPAIEYADQPTLQHLRRPKGLIARMMYRESQGEEVHKVGLYKLVRDGHAEYLFNRLKEKGETLALSDYNLGHKAGMKTVLDMLVEQKQLAAVMDPDQWPDGEQNLGRLLVVVSVPDDVLMAQTGLDRQMLLAELKATPSGRRVMDYLEDHLAWLKKLHATPEEMGEKPIAKEDPAESPLLAVLPVAGDAGASITQRIAAGEKLMNLVDAPEPINWTQAEKLVLRMEDQVAERDATIEEQAERIKSLEAELAKKPTSVIVTRDMTPGERLVDLSEFLAGKPEDRLH